MTTPRGRFITFDGGEGAGKSTQVRRLADRLTADGVALVLTREPGGAPGAEAIRSLLVDGAVDRWTPASEALLLYAARMDLWSRVIDPALSAGQWVVCDRFADSTLAYQGHAGGLSMDAVRAIHDAVLPGVRPDLTLWLDVDPAIGLERAKTRARQTGTDLSRFEQFDLAHHRAIAEGFRAIAAAEPNRVKRIDAHGDPDEVARAVWTAMERAGLAPTANSQA